MFAKSLIVNQIRLFFLFPPFSLFQRIRLSDFPALVQTKLGTLGEVKGVVIGAFGEGSDDLHSLIHHLPISRVRVAGTQKGKRGQVRTEEAELAITTSFLRRTLSVVGVSIFCQKALHNLLRSLWKIVRRLGKQSNSYLP